MTYKKQKGEKMNNNKVSCVPNKDNKFCYFIVKPIVTGIIFCVLVSICFVVVWFFSTFFPTAMTYIFIMGGSLFVLWLFGFIVLVSDNTDFFDNLLKWWLS